MGGLTHGADIVSVNRVTGEVTLWDNKYRSADRMIGESGTFTKTEPLTNAVSEATDAIQNSHLPQGVKDQALQNLRDGIFATRTVGDGAARNTIISVRPKP